MYLKRHSLVKRLKVKDQEKNLQSSKRKMVHCIQENNDLISS